MGPACDNLDHRARACYCHVVFCMLNFVMLLACAQSWFPPPLLEHALHLVNQSLHHSGAKTDVFSSLINSCTVLETQQLNVAGS